MKIAIIGAGINGLYLAWKLSGKGYQVTVFEKKEKIGKEVCSGLFSEKILEFIPQSKQLIKNEIKSVLIHFPRKELKINFSKRFLIINHFELDNFAADLARKSGTDILTEKNITKQELINLQDSFERIIGCDGVFSGVREFLGLRKPHFRLGIQGFAVENNNEDSVEAWPVKSGFVWKIPHGNMSEYGIISSLSCAKKNFDDFCRKNCLKLQGVKAALIPQDLIIPQNGKITLCGDAAGLTKPWSGGGVIWGLVAADILLKNFPDFIKYRKAVENFFSMKILFSKTATGLVYFLGFKVPWFLPEEFKIEGDFLV